jgi:hypothetical protein
MLKAFTARLQWIRCAQAQTTNVKHPTHGDVATLKTRPEKSSDLCRPYTLDEVAIETMHESGTASLPTFIIA